MTTLFERVALIAVMAVATFMMGDIEIITTPCSGGNSGTFECCHYMCMKDHGSGCNGSVRCCNQLCQ